MNLKLFRKQLRSVNSCHFYACDLPVSVPFLSVRAVEMTDSLAKNFTMSFSGFPTHATNMSIFENLFSVEVSNASEKLKLELIELHCELGF
jgi:hypothetical protein